MMEASFRFILATLAATAALVGCTKEFTPDFENDKVNPAAEGSRVIAVSFAPGTKTTLEEGLQPKFADGDSILISNGEALDTCEVKVDDKGATITTKLTGPLNAVYPAKAAKMNETNKNQIDTVLVSTEQDGTFASANICMAKNISEDAKTATFENKTAVFRIIPAAGKSAQCVEVSAEGFEIANCYQEGSTYTTCNTIHVAPITTDTVYVSILVPENLTVGKLTFSDGTNEKTVTTGDRVDEKIAAGTIYSVTVEPNSFAITCEAVTITGASFSVTKENAAVTEASLGDALKINVTCPFGYIVDGIKVCKTDDASTMVEVGTDRSFTMPAYAVTVKVEFELDESGGGTELTPGGLLS